MKNTDKAVTGERTPARGISKLYAERIASEWSEEDSGDGYWMSLREGYTLDGASVIHELTRKACLNRLSEVSYQKQLDAAVTDAGNAPRKIRTVADIPEDWQLVQDSQDVHATLESIGKLNEGVADLGCLFVKVGDGDYDAVYGCDRYIPLLTARVYKLR